MKKVFPVAVWVIVICGVIVGWHVYTKNSEQKAKFVEHAKKEPTHKAIIELANKYNAVVDWKGPLSKIESPVFTMEVENALLYKDNRPVLFFATITDIERKENTYTVRFTNEFGEQPKIEFILNCSDEQVRKITQQQSESRMWDDYAVIATINKVKKIISKDGWDGDAFVTTGLCIDLLFVEDYSYDDFHPEDK